MGVEGEDLLADGEGLVEDVVLQVELEVANCDLLVLDGVDVTEEVFHHAVVENDLFVLVQHKAAEG